MTDIGMIEDAAKRLAPVVVETPMLTSPFIDEIAGRRVFIKAECLQRTGTFKFRGAWSAISALGAGEGAKGVLAFSSGNHAQGVALAARMHGIPATIVMPADAPKIKIDNTAALGAEIILYNREHEDRDKIGATLATERGLHLIKPFDDPEVIAGQGTCGLEIAKQTDLTEADVYVCCGGGGLTSGIALALEAHAPTLRVRTCEPEGFDDVARSLERGTRQTNPYLTGSICDALVVPTPGALTFPIMSRLCGPGLVVSDHDCLRAVKVAFERLKIVLEPGGAIALAAALFHSDRADHFDQADDVIVVATGGNVDPRMFQRALSTDSVL